MMITYVFSKQGANSQNMRLLIPLSLVIHGVTNRKNKTTLT